MFVVLASIASLSTSLLQKIFAALQKKKEQQQKKFINAQ